IRVQILNRTLLHNGGGLQGCLLVPLLKDAFEHLENTNGRYDQAIDVFDSRREFRRIWTVGEVLQPGGRIHHIHTRSFSRGTVVSIPVRKPRISFMGLTGINSTRFAYSSA